MVLQINDVIGIILIIVIIIVITYKHSVKEHFTITSENIVSRYNLHISAVRNMAQLASKILTYDSKALKYTLYLPINNINIGNLTVTTTEIVGDLNINNNFVASKINEFEENPSSSSNFDIYPQFMIMPWCDMNKIPKNWFLCDGSKYVYKMYETPTKYIKNDDDAFLDTSVDVPDLRNKFVLNVNNQTYTTEEDVINIIPIRTHRFNETGGVEKEILTSNHIPLHNHYFNLTTLNQDITFNQTLIDKSNIKTYLVSDDNYPLTTKEIGSEYNNGKIDFKNIGGTPQGNIHIKNQDYRIINTLESANISTQNKTGDPYYMLWDVSTGDFKFNHKTDSHENMPPYYKLFYIIKL